MTPLLRATEVAALLSVSRSAVYRLAESGALPRVAIGESVRFRVEDVEAFIAQRRIARPALSMRACK